jgi:hypothetical protein
MTTEYPWYQEAPCAAALTQGDIVLQLPVLVFDEQVQQATSHDDFTQRLQSMAGVERRDLVVVTQACDLENDHVRSVQLCPLASLSECKQRWAQAEKIRGQNPSDNS